MSESTRVAAWRLGIIFGALLLVEASVRGGWISTFFLAAPTRAAIVFWQQLAHGNALLLTGITLFEIATCLSIATVFGVLAGFFLWRYKLIGTSYEMLLASLFSSPVILAYPIFLVTFGRTSAAVIALSSIFGLIPIIMNTRGAFQNVNPILLQVGASMNLTIRPATTADRPELAKMLGMSDAEVDEAGDGAIALNLAPPSRQGWFGTSGQSYSRWSS